MTRAMARWGCFLPDLTRLASGSSTTRLPLPISFLFGPNASRARRFSNAGRHRQPKNHKTEMKT